MSYGSRRKYRVNDIYRRHLVETAKLSRFDEDKMEEMIDQTISEMPEVIEKVRTLLPGSFPKKIADSVLTGMTKRKRQFTKT